MFINYRYFNLCSFIFAITFLSTIASFCSELSSTADKDAPCFLEAPTNNPLVLRSAGNSLVLPCHVARSKRVTVEWWYSDLQNLVNIKIYPVYPAVRPTVLRFVTSLTPFSKDSNETDILDASILLRHVNVDDSGIYRCVIRPWQMDPMEQTENVLLSDETTIATLGYEVQLTGPRLCQSSPGGLPCFTAMRTSSPTVIDAYATAFLQCVVKTPNPPANVFWVVGDAATNNVLITDHLTSNQYRGDRLRRVFPLSVNDHSLELTINRTNTERVYSCVIAGANDFETTLFTYIIRNINIENINAKKPISIEKIPSHDSLNLEEIDSLRENKKVTKDEENAIDHDESEEKDTDHTSTPSI